MTSIKKDELYYNRLNILREAMKSREYTIIDFIFYNHKIDIDDINYNNIRKWFNIFF